MKNRTPTPRDQRAPLPDFAPVPRQCARHDGWTPERQRAFIEALADTGSVSTAAAMVNMTPEGAYMLRRHPKGAGFRAAWEAALDMGVLRIKDEAFERAINGQLVPVFAGGRLLGYRRKKNDRLLMFILRHYGEDAQGRRTTLNLFQARVDVDARIAATPAEPTAVADAAPPPTRRLGPRAGDAPALPAPDVPLPIDLAPDRAIPRRRRRAPERIDRSAATLADFPVALLDEEEQRQVYAILESAAARRRATRPGDDPGEPFVPANLIAPDHPDVVGAGLFETTDAGLRDGDETWQTLDQPDQREAIAAAVAAVKAAARDDRRREPSPRKPDRRPGKL